MNRDFWKRSVSMLLVVQMLCTSVSYAVQPPKQGEAEAPRPDGLSNAVVTEDKGPESAQIQDVGVAAGLEPLAAQPPYGYRETTVGTEWLKKEGSGYPNRFEVEGEKDTNISIAVDKTEGYSYLQFPDNAALGRFPDWQFEAWYVYGKPGKIPAKNDERFWEEGFTKLERDEADPSKSIQIRSMFPELDEVIAQNDKTYNALYKIPIIGRWVLSDRSKPTGLSLYGMEREGTSADPLVLYREETAGRTPGELNALTEDPDKTGFAAGVHEYWLRVDSSVEALALDLSAFEPYADYDTVYKGDDESAKLDKSPVKVTLQQSTSAAADDCTGLLSYYLENDGKLTEQPFGGTAWDPQNSEENPAHSTWRIGFDAAEEGAMTFADYTRGIPLTASAGAGRYYNTITVTVLPPNGDAAQRSEYVFHVQRMADPVLEQRPGNTPIGMIWRDNGPGFPTEAARQAAAESFIQGHLFDKTLYPTGENNNEGHIYNNLYTPGAWVETQAEPPSPNYREIHPVNVDEDRTAIVAYQNGSFTDPGFTIVDSQGNLTTFGAGAGAYETAVKRTIALRQVEKLDFSALESGAGSTGYYENDDAGQGVLSGTETADIILSPDGKDEVDLRGMKIAPGIYRMEYAFEDPISGKTYSSDPGSFYAPNADNAAQFVRFLVVLPVPGDVDMDGAVTPADALALQALFDKKILTVENVVGINGKAPDPLKALFALRVCDVDGDGLVVYHNESAARDELDQGDLDKLNSGWTPAVTRDLESDYFYLPPEAGEGRGQPARKPVPEGTDAGKANLTLEYLGKDPSAPNLTPTEGEGVKLNEVFWVGVKLANADQLPETVRMDIRELRVALAYDSEFLALADVEESGASDQWILGGCNLSPVPGQGTIWQDPSATNYTAMPSTTADRAYGTHPSKGVSPLESSVGTGNLKEVVLSVRCTGTAVGLEDGYLMFVPFRLVKYPEEQATGSLTAVGLSLGMEELWLSAGQNGASATAAYSTGEIFGGVTQNLGDYIRTPNGTTLTVNLGENTTVRTLLVNQTNGGETVYGDPYECYLGVTYAEITGSGWPVPGLTYVEGEGRIEGVPERAGTYDFNIKGQPYRIVVDRAPLRYYAEDHVRYYGEGYYCGDDSGSLTYRYYTGDIQALDTARVDNGTVYNDGKSQHLPALLGASGTVKYGTDPTVYTEPVLLAVQADGTAPLTADAPVGGYPITEETAPTATNYQFVFVDKAEDPEQPGEAGAASGTLAVEKRPIAIAGLNAESSPVGSIYDDGAMTLTVARTQCGPEADQFAVKRADQLPSDIEGNYNGLPLSGFGIYTHIDGTADALSVAYTATFSRTEADQNAPAGKNFNLTEDEEERPVTVTGFTLLSEGAAANYVLVKTEADDASARGTVTKRPLSEIKLVQLPKMAYTYGEEFHLYGELWIRRIFGEGDGAVEEPIRMYSKEDFEQNNLKVTWATEEEKAQGLAGSIEAFENQKLTVKKSAALPDAAYDGLYLCVSSTELDGDGKPKVVAYSHDAAENDVTLKVEKRPLHLTVQDQTRYYGEENAPLSFQYDKSMLASWDRPAADSTLDFDGDMDELGTSGSVALSGYEAPKLRAVRSLKGYDDESDTANNITSASGVTLLDDYIAIWGGGADNYYFIYGRPGQDREDAGQDFGYGTLMIYPRPIVVESITADPALTVYADSHQLVRPNQKLTLAQTAVSLPAHTGDSATYYPAGGSGNNQPTVSALGFAKEQGVVNGDSLGFTCTMEILPDLDKPNGTDKGYFELEGAASKSGYRVVVSNLKLDGTYAAKKNYTLVFNENGDAVNGYPASRDNGDYASATGAVKLRAITGIALTYLPKMGYQYGDTFLPDVPGGQGRPLTVTLTYEDTYGKLNNGTNREQLSYGKNMISGENYFESKGLEIYYWEDGVSSADETAVTGADVAVYGAYITVGGQDGLSLAVSGRKHPSHPLVTSASSKAALDTVLSVEKKTLTLSVERQNRFYGEENGTYTFTFDLEDLAQRDRDALALMGEAVTGTAKGTAAALGAPAGCAVLEKLNEGYTGPVFATDAAPGSDVLDGGYGGYDLLLSSPDPDGDMDNYTFAFEQSKIYVFRRPFYVKGVISSYDADPNRDNSIYTIYSNTTQRKFWTEIERNRIDPYVNYGSQSSSDPAASGLKPMMLSDFAFYGEDEMRIKLQVDFKNLPTDADLKNQSNTAHDVTVGLCSIVPGYDKNYVLKSPNPIDTAAVGRVDLRSIESIEIVSPPDKPLGGYTYGEGLDLDGLVVRIFFKRMVTEAQTQMTDIRYIGTDSFNEQGLYLNYWGSAGAPSQGHYGDGVEGRVADQGDHMSIAPVHDGSGFSHDGKYLIISARRHVDQDYVEPQIIPGQIKIAPKELAFTAAADGKTYDGTTRAVGTVALTNVYGAHTDDPDRVYLPVGADYEKDAAALLEQLKTEGFVFTTGSYDSADALPDGGGDGGLTFGEGYDPERHLKFAFVDPNVRYAKDPAWDDWGDLAAIPVEVTRMTLAGADAANYTWKAGDESQRSTTALLTDPAAPTPGGMTAVPEAVIHKSERSAPDPSVRPKLEVDLHTNVVRLTYDRTADEFRDRDDPMEQEDATAIHLEYALELRGADAQGGTEPVRWAGPDGTDPYQDTRFFGGEPVVVEPPAGYVPEEEQPGGEEEQVQKGQLYAWAEEDPGFGVEVDENGAYVKVDGAYVPLRKPLPRGAALTTAAWGLVRVAETHNYLPSPPLYSVSDLDGALDEAIAQAERTAQAESDRILDLAKNGVKNEEPVRTAAKPAPAVKLYEERLELVSTEEKRGKEGDQQFQVSTLEAVWFTNLLQYSEDKVLDLVVENQDPTRYYGYYWDESQSARLEFKADGQEYLDLSGPLEVEVERRTEGGETVKETATVNAGNTARLYVSLRAPSSGGGQERSIRIFPGALEGSVGDRPVQLIVEFIPEEPRKTQIKWSSSDERVAAVSEDGLVTFVGAGTATITAVSYNKKRDQIQVIVHEAKDWPTWYDPQRAVFDLGYEKPFAALDAARRFQPERQMTRADLVTFLAQFYREAEGWTRRGVSTFEDVPADAAYRADLELLTGLGIITGVSDGVFAPDQVATRAELAVILCRMLDLKVESTKGRPHAFVDAGEGDTWAYSYIDTLARMGVVDGTGHGYFYPDRLLTRAEAATFVAKLLGGYEGYRPGMAGLTEPVDVPAQNWAWPFVMRALNGPSKADTEQEQR